MGTYAIALKNRDFLDLIKRGGILGSLPLSTLHVCEIKEGTVVSSLACRMSCSSTPVLQRKTGVGKLYKDNLQDQNGLAEGKTLR